MRSLPLAALGWLCLALIGSAARASDGVLEISQVCADTTGPGCFPGDAAGFPVTITQPGSYRLTSNVVVPADTSGIRLETDGVFIDLNGFRVLGPFICPVPCFSGTGTGVESATGLGHRVSISNGEISGFGLDGVNLRNDAHVERLLVTNAGRHGIVINSGSIALANRIRAVGDNGLRMVDNASGLGAPIYRDNVIRDANLAGAGADFASGGRATGGNGCSDGSCSQRGTRRFYLTTTQRNGAQALTACAAGYHMGSLWEISDPSTLEYDRTRGLVGADTGNGPPYFSSGWVRTGSPGFGTGGPPGQANCLAWTSAQGVHTGTYAYLAFDWSIPPPSSIHPWIAAVSACSANVGVWCVED